MKLLPLTTLIVEISLDASDAGGATLRLALTALEEFPSAIHMLAGDCGFRYTVRYADGKGRLALIFWFPEQEVGMELKIQCFLVARGLNVVTLRDHCQMESMRETDTGFARSRREVLFSQSLFSLRAFVAIEKGSTRLLLAMLQLHACIDALGFTPVELVHFLLLYLWRLRIENPGATDARRWTLPDATAAKLTGVLNQASSIGCTRLIPDSLQSRSAALLDAVKLHRRELVRRSAHQLTASSASGSLVSADISQDAPGCNIVKTDATLEPEDLTCNFFHEFRHFFFNQLCLDTDTEAMVANCLLEFWRRRISSEDDVKIRLRMEKYFNAESFE
jgi:hypothetical protein